MSAILPNQAARDCLFVLRMIRREFDGELSWPVIERKVAQLIKYDQNSIRLAVAAGQNAQEIVRNGIINVCFDEGTSGAHHIYRGRLSMTGLSFASVFYKNVDAQFGLGLLSDEQKSELLRNFEEAKQGAG